jgi:hypothetical protein
MSHAGVGLGSLGKVLVESENPSFFSAEFDLFFGLVRGGWV